MLINDRRRFSNIPTDVIRIFDKLDKIGLDGVVEELKEKGCNTQEIERYKFLITSGKEMAVLIPLFNILEKDFGLKKDEDFIFSPSLARGLDYYTSTIFELKPNGKPEELTIGAGGRYDNLIGTFVGRDIPAVGFSFGIDRILELL
jgi:histidyl-tRNA synthetase